MLTFSFVDASALLCLFCVFWEKTEIRLGGGKKAKKDPGGTGEAFPGGTGFKPVFLKGRMSAAGFSAFGGVPLYLFLPKGLMISSREKVFHMN